MNRKQFAETVAQAYMDQYHHQEWRRSPVMNNPVIDFDPDDGQFSSCSSLTPQGDDFRVLELSDGMFGSDENPTKAGIVYFLMHDDGIWNEVVDAIADAHASQF